MTEWAAPKPCKRGHISERYINGKCIQCRKEQRKKRYAINAEVERERSRRRRVLMNIIDPEGVRKRERERHQRRYFVVGYLGYKYNMSKDRYTRLLIDQAGLCGLCNEPMMGKHDPVVDHIKGTKIVRGLLHNRCNSGLWGVEDTKFRQMALLYLSEFEW